MAAFEAEYPQTRVIVCCDAIDEMFTCGNDGRHVSVESSASQETFDGGGSAGSSGGSGSSSTGSSRGSSSGKTAGDC